MTGIFKPQQISIALFGFNQADNRTSVTFLKMPGGALSGPPEFPDGDGRSPRRIPVWRPESPRGSSVFGFPIPRGMSSRKTSRCNKGTLRDRVTRGTLVWAVVRLSRKKNLRCLTVFKNPCHIRFKRCQGGSHVIIDAAHVGKAGQVLQNLALGFLLIHRSKDRPISGVGGGEILGLLGRWQRTSTPFGADAGRFPWNRAERGGWRH